MQLNFNGERSRRGWCSARPRAGRFAEDTSEGNLEPDADREARSAAAEPGALPETTSSREVPKSPPTAEDRLPRSYRFAKMRLASSSVSFEPMSNQSPGTVHVKTGTRG
jgi:hypothetical protein